jgi:hypothetical protein
LGTVCTRSEIDSWRKRKKCKSLEVAHVSELNDSDI